MPNSERILILSTDLTDDSTAIELLRSAGRQTSSCASLESVSDGVVQGAGCAILCDELLADGDLSELGAWLDAQPAWSDFPFVVLTGRSGGPSQNADLAALQSVLGNVIFLERPFHPASLANVVDNALRARRRQYQARALLEDLQEGEQRLATALTAGHLGSWLFDIGSRTLTLSSASKDHFGFEAADEVSFEAFLDAIVPIDRDRVEKSLAACIASGDDCALEYRVVWPDGMEHWLDVRVRLQRDHSGRPAHMVGVSSDITARKNSEVERERLLLMLASERERTQQALRGEQALSGLLMTSVPAGIIAYDPNLAITAWNPVMERLVGVEASAVVGRPLFEVVAAEQSRAMRNRVDDALSGEAGPVEELEFDTDEQGKVWLETQHAPLRDGDGNVVGGLAFFRDVTERRRAEEQLRQAQKMETIGQLTGGVAHDFNNLLSAVLGNLELLRKKLPDDPSLRRHIDGAMQGARRGASLTQRLLAFARRQDLQPEPTDLGVLVEGMRGLLERSLDALVKINIHVPQDLPPAIVDPNQLELAILNLAVNARDAMPDGGTLTVTLERREGRGRELAGPFLVLTVADTGTGMDDQTLASAIEPFFSTKELGKGTGLGLSMVHGLAQQLGGALILKSELGVGTVAELWLPVAAAPVEERRRMEPLSLDAPASKILVVDDDALIAMNTVDMVEDLGHTVLEAYSGAQALEILSSDTHIDALITDYAMPGMTGVELATKAREIRPDLPILLATGYADLPNGTTTDLPRLAKPYQQQDLAQQLARILARSD